jgi:hypothetical protein
MVVEPANPEIQLDQNKCTLECSIMRDKAKIASSKNYWMEPEN